METNTILCLGLGVASVILVVVILFKLKARQDEIRALIEDRFAGSKIIRRDQAYLVSQESRGLSQRQGVGTLILTENELFFAVPLPRLVVSIPLARVGELERTRRMGAKSTMRTMLKVNYVDEHGEPDALGLRVKEPDLWESDIRTLSAPSGRS